MGLISLLFQQPVAFFILVVVLLYSVIIHEISHGWVAYLFGDGTAKNEGRLSLNPVSHVDPLGAIALLLVGFGWAKPVPVNYRNLKNFRVGLVMVALAGCVANIIIASIAIILLSFETVNSNATFVMILEIVARINILLAALNLIPMPPLDGSKILMGFLPRSGQRFVTLIEPYGFFILIFFLYMGVLEPVIEFTQNSIISIISIFLRGLNLNIG